MPTTEQVAQLRDGQKLEWAEIGERLGISESAARRLHKKKELPAKHEPEDAKTVVSGDDCEVIYFSTEAIKTEAQALLAGEVDTAVWYVEKMEMTPWTTSMNIGTKDSPRLVQVQNYRVHLKLKRRAPQAVLDSLDILFERMRKHAPTNATKHRRAAGGCLAVIGLFDAHFGKLAWEAESGENYDLHIAERVFSNAVDDLLLRCAHRRITRFLLPVGNDLLHVDNDRNQTWAGTQMDTDGRLAKVYATAKMAVIRAVERMIEVAPVHVEYVPGNHDHVLSMLMVDTLYSWFRATPLVTVNHRDLATRKYVRFGTCLIGLTHGNEEPIANLPGLMASERRKDWAESECREWLTGHVHQERKWTTKAVQTTDSVVIRSLHSLAGTDAWHHRKGYVCNRKAADVLFYDHDEGYLGHEVAYRRD